MNNNKFNKEQHIAFINRQRELEDLRLFIDKEPAEILFIHGPKSSGKTTLLYKLFNQLEKEQKLDVKFLNLREMVTEFSDDFDYKDFLRMFFQVKPEKEKKEKLSAGINVGLFKIDAEIEKNLLQGKSDPFKVMKEKFIQLRNDGVKPVLIVDELQALDKIYMNNGKGKQLIIALFNFFVAMTKESNLAHIIIASSDGYFLNTVYTDSRLKKSSRFYKMDYLGKEDVMEWLLNLETYSRIKDYTLSHEDAEKIWDTVGGSMWEIQDILTELFNTPIDETLALYKKKIKGFIEYYIGTDMRKEKVLQVFLENETARIRDFIPGGIALGEIHGLLKDMVRNNILYFDPTAALYYPQGKSYRWGIKLYFEESERNSQSWKPKVFIGSSSDTNAKKAADIVKGYLEEDKDIEVVVWHQLFKTTETYIEGLSKALDKYDFAILIITQENYKQSTIRQNVLFELGLFMGGLGRHKTIMLYAENPKPKLPTDLGGIHTQTFSSAGPLEDNLKNPCAEIKKYILDPYEEEIRVLEVWKKSCHHIYEALEKAPPDATIRIIQTWFPDLEEFIEELENLLTKKNKRFKFRILLIDHDPEKDDNHFDILGARIKRRKETRESAMKKIADSIAQFEDLKKNVEDEWEKSKGKHISLDLKILRYDFLPFGPYYQIGDKEMFVGFYLNYCSSINAPMVKILPTAKTAWHRFENHFNKGWENSKETPPPDNSTGGKKEKTDENDHH